MERKDGGTAGRSTSLKLIVAIIVVAVLTFAVVYTESLVVGYVAATLLLCAFFVVVAFDVGVPKTASAPADRANAAENRPVSRTRASSTRDDAVGG